MSGLFPQQPAMKAQPHANRGKAFEAQLGLQLERYRAQGWLVIRQYPAVLLENGGKSAKVIGKAPPDWILHKHGQFLAIDAKSHQGERWPLSEVADHLAAWFFATEQSGGIAGIVLNLNGAIWWLPWEELGPRWSRWKEGDCPRGLASLEEDALIEVGNRVAGCDFLAVVGGGHGR